ncbi:MAG: hypothetical protein ACPHUC_07670 [Psychrobacter celer]
MAVSVIKKRLGIWFMPFDVSIIMGLGMLGKLRNSNLTFYKTNRKPLKIINIKTTLGGLPWYQGGFFATIK